MTAIQRRYYLPKKSIKGHCPKCYPKHRKTLSRFVDRETDEPLPEQFGRCDREDHCGYYLSPYEQTESGVSYANEQNAPPLPKEWFRMAGKWKRLKVSRGSIVQTLITQTSATHEQAERVADYVFKKPATPPPPPPIYALPDEVFTRSIKTGHYGRNNFYKLLCQQFGMIEAHNLMQRFQIGTSAYWNGATVFWLTDTEGRARGGQVVAFADDWHKAKYTDGEGNRKPCITSVGYSLTAHYQRNRTNRSAGAVPEWLSSYRQQAETWPVVFGLPQLQTAPASKPVALVEAPKTAVVCSAYMPEFTWLAVGGKSYLKAERLAALKGRAIMLYPDLNAYHDAEKDGRVTKGWLTYCHELQQAGFRVDVSDFLEQHATEQQRADGLDLADFLLQQPPRSSGSWPPPGSVPEFIPVDSNPSDPYPPEWDTLYDASDVPTLNVVKYNF